MSTQTVTVSFDEARLEALDRAVASNGFADRSELVEATMRRYLHRQLLDELIEQTGDREPSKEELEEELKALKKVRREIWEKEHAHLLSGQ